MSFCIFFFNDTATTEIYTLSLHDALPISDHDDDHGGPLRRPADRARARRGGGVAAPARPGGRGRAPLLAARDPLSDAGLLHVPRGAGGARARAPAAAAPADRGSARAPTSRRLLRP